MKVEIGSIIASKKIDAGKSAITVEDIREVEGKKVFYGTVFGQNGIFAVKESDATKFNSGDAKSIDSEPSEENDTAEAEALAAQIAKDLEVAEAEENKKHHGKHHGKKHV